MGKGQFDTVILDWDGCLADTLSIWMNAYLKVFGEYGLHPSEKDIAEKVFGVHSGFRIVGVKDDDGFRIRLNREVDAGLKQARLHPGVYDTLLEMKKRDKTLAILSSSKREVVEAAIAFNQLPPIFSSIICKEDVKSYKPDPEGIRKTLDHTGMTQGKTIIVGDADKDVEAGRNAHIATCIFYPAPNRAIYHKDFLIKLKPDYFIEDFKELLSIIK